MILIKSKELVFFDKNQTLINVEKFTKEDMILISKKRSPGK